MAYTFKDPISLIPDDLGLVRTAKMIRDTREYNRFDTDNIYSMLNTAQVAPGDEWIINDLHETVDSNLGEVVSSGKYFGATNAVAQSVSALKNSKGLKLASQSWANYQEGKKIEKEIMAKTGGALNFSDNKWKTHSSYYRDENGKWIENVFQPQVEKEENYNQEMITLIGKINADSGGINFKKYKVNPGDIRDFISNPKGISKDKAKRIALSLVDAYTNGHIGDQDFRKLTQLDINPSTGNFYTEEEALDDISQRLIDIASRQVYWTESVSQLPKGSTGSGNTTPPAGQGMWTPVQGSAINSALTWENIEGFTGNKINAVIGTSPIGDSPESILNTNTSNRTSLQALRNQETLIVNNYGTDDQIAAYNEMTNSFYGHENLRDLLQHLSQNTTEWNYVDIPDIEGIPSQYYSEGPGDMGFLTAGNKDFQYHGVRMWSRAQGEEQKLLVSMLLNGKGQGGGTAEEKQQNAIYRLNATLGTNYTVADVPELTGLINNYFKYQIATGDGIDELMETRGGEMTTQLSGYSINPMLDTEGTLGDINKMLTQSTLNQFTIDGVINGSDEYKAIMNKILTSNKSGDVTSTHQPKFKQITQPGISTGTPSRFMLEVAPGEVYTLTENYGLEQMYGGGFTNAVLQTMTSQNPLILSQEVAAKNVQRKIQTGEYQLTGDGSIRATDYLAEIAPIIKQNIANMFIREVNTTQGYSPDFSQFNEEETNAYLTYEATQLNRYRDKVMKKLVWTAHMQLVDSSSPEVPQEYLGIKDVAELMRILESDYDYLVLLQNYGVQLPSSLITDLTGL